MCVIATVLWLQFRLNPEERQFVGTWVMTQPKSAPIKVEVGADRVWRLTFDDQSVANYRWEVTGSKLIFTQQEPASLQSMKRQVQATLLKMPTSQPTEVFQWERTGDGYTLTDVSGNNAVSPSVFKLNPTP